MLVAGAGGGGSSLTGSAGGSVQPATADGDGDDRLADADDVKASSPEERASDGAAGAGDADGFAGRAAETEPGQAAGLVRRLLTGSAETTHTCCACGAVSRHVDCVTDLHLALPETLTRPPTAAGGTIEILYTSR